MSKCRLSPSVERCLQFLWRGGLMRRMRTTSSHPCPGFLQRGGERPWKRSRERWRWSRRLGRETRKEGCQIRRLALSGPSGDEPRALHAQEFADVGDECAEAPATLPRLGKTLPRSSSDVRSTAFLLYYAPRGDSFPDVYSAIIAYSGKSLPAFFAAPEIYFPLILLTQVNIRDNLSRIFRDKGKLQSI